MNEIEIANPPKSIGGRIRQSRKACNLSQADLARRIGVTQPAVANWESGVHDPRRLMLARLADALQTPLDWLAGGDRSALERDKHAGAAYIRRALQHVPIISMETATLFAHNQEIDPHTLAEDYIPVTANTDTLFAVFIDDEAVNLAFPPASLVVVDYNDNQPQDGNYCLALTPNGPLVRQWNDNPRQLRPLSSSQGHKTIDVSDMVTVIGSLLVAIRIL